MLCEFKCKYGHSGLGFLSHNICTLWQFWLSIYDTHWCYHIKYLSQLHNQRQILDQLLNLFYMVHFFQFLWHECHQILYAIAIVLQRVVISDWKLVCIPVGQLHLDLNTWSVLAKSTYSIMRDIYLWLNYNTVVLVVSRQKSCQFDYHLTSARWWLFNLFCLDLLFWHHFHDSCYF